MTSPREATPTSETDMDSSAIKYRLTAFIAAVRAKGLKRASGQVVFNNETPPFVSIWWGVERKQFSAPTVEECLAAADEWAESLPTPADQLRLNYEAAKQHVAELAAQIGETVDK